MGRSVINDVIEITYGYGTIILDHFTDASSSVPEWTVIQPLRRVWLSGQHKQCTLREVISGGQSSVQLSSELRSMSKAERQTFHHILRFPSRNESRGREGRGVLDYQQ